MFRFVRVLQAMKEIHIQDVLLILAHNPLVELMQNALRTVGVNREF